MQTQYIPRTTTFSKGNVGPSSRLQDKVNLLNSGWFPINSDHLWRVKDNIKNGSYVTDPQLLASDIKHDQALLGLCLKNFKSIRKDNLPINNPLSDLERVDVNKLRTLLELPQALPQHDLKDADKPQALRIKQSITACVCTQEMAQRAEVDSNLAYSVAYLQQLSLNLLAWNFPEIFVKLMAARRRDGEDLDKACRRLMGHSLHDLSISVLQDWDLSSELRSYLHSQNNNSGNAATLSSKLEKIVELGQAFADSQEGDKYPKMRERWDALASEADKYLAPDSLEKIKNASAELSRHYRHQLAEYYEEVFEKAEEEQKPVLSFGERLFQKNSYAQRCPEHLRTTFEEIYKKLAKGSTNTDSINLLVNIQTPAAGFSGGCIYGLSQDRIEFVPVLTFGKQPASYYKSVQTRKKEFLLHALQSILPIKHDLSINPGENASLISAALLGSPKPAILCLELQNEKEDAELNHDAIKHFKAIRQCWEDCLGLG